MWIVDSDGWWRIVIQDGWWGWLMRMVYVESWWWLLVMMMVVQNCWWRMVDEDGRCGWLMRMVDNEGCWWLVLRMVDEDGWMVPVGLVSAQSAPGSSRILHVKQINEDTGESNPDYDWMTTALIPSELSTWQGTYENKYIYTYIYIYRWHACPGSYTSEQRLWTIQIIVAFFDLQLNYGIDDQHQLLLLLLVMKIDGISSSIIEST